MSSIFAPSMDLDMHDHPSTIANIKKLEEFGNKLIHSEHGELASGLTGYGRMAESKEFFSLYIKIYLHRCL